MRGCLALIEGEQGLRRCLSHELKTAGRWQLVVESDTGRDGLEQCLLQEPEVVVLDLDVGDWDGIELARVLRRNLAGVRILATSRRRDPVWLNRLVEVGARGFLLKERAARHLDEALGKIASGQESFPVEVRELRERLKRDPRAFSKILTGREQDILRHLVAGRTSRHMAELLSLSPRSVETFRYRLMRKLGVSNAAGLVEFAFRNGLLAEDCH